MCTLTIVEKQLAALLDEGKDANTLVASLSDETISDRELASRLFELGVDASELARVTDWEACFEIAAKLLQAGVDVDWLVEKMRTHLSRSSYLYGIKKSAMVAATVRLAADYGVKASTIMALAKESGSCAQNVLRQIDCLYEHGCKLDIDECLQNNLVCFGTLGEDIEKVIDVGYPLEKIVHQCAKERELNPNTVATLVAHGVDVSEIADSHLQLVVKYPKQFGGVKDPEVLYEYLTPDSDFDALIGEFGMEPKYTMERIFGHWRIRDEVDRMLEPLLRNGLKPREYAELAIRGYNTGTVVKNFRLLKQYDPEFDLEPGTIYEILHEGWLKDLLDCGANRDVVIDSVIWSAPRTYRFDGVPIVEKMLELATAEEARRLLTELPERIVSRTLIRFINSDKLGPEDVATALERLSNSGQNVTMEVSMALPNLCARGVPIKRDILESIVKNSRLLDEEKVECLVKYGFKLSELAEHMDVEALKDNIEALAEDGYDPDKLALALLTKGEDFDEDLDEDFDEGTRERLKKVGAKLWV